MFTKKSYVFAGVFVLLGAVSLVGSLRGEPRRELAATVDLPESRRVLPAELADWIITGRRDFAVVDLRETASFEKAHVRGAVSCGTCHQSREEGRAEQFVDLSKKLVLYTEGDAERVTLPRGLASSAQLYRLAGGWKGWQEQVLAPVTFEGLADEAALEAAKKREAIRAFMAGERAAAPAAKLPLTPIKRSGAHTPAGSSEGC